MPSELSGLTDDPSQNYPITLPDGSLATFVFEFWPQQNGWFYTKTWNGQTPPFQDGWEQLVVSPNVLRQWKNILPFGIACGTATGEDPTDQEDFVNGNCTLLLLNASDVVQVESDYYQGN